MTAKSTSTPTTTEMTVTTTNNLLVQRRRADLETAAVAYAITRIRDFTRNGQTLTPAQRDMLRALADG